MGTTYSNCQVRSDSQDAVAEALTPLLKEPAYVSPSVGGWVGVYPEGSDTDAIEKLAKKLSTKLVCGVFFWSVYDSDIFFYTLYENGKLRDRFDSNPDYFEPVTKAKKSSLSGKPEALVQYCLPGIGYSRVQEVLHPPLSTVPDEDLPADPKMAEKHLLMFSKILKTTPDAMRQEWKQLKRRKYQFADEHAGDMAKLLGIAEDLEPCEYRDIAEASRFAANRYRVARQFRLVGTENLSQAYKNAKLWSSFRLDDLKSAVALGSDVNARDVSGLPILVKLAQYCAVEQIQYLIKMGADVNAATHGTGPDHAGFVLMGARLEDGVTPLMAAAGASREHPPYQNEMIQMLLDVGADVNVRSETGRTALSEAIAMTNWQNHSRKIRRRAPEDVLRQAAERSLLVVEMLRAAGATE